MKQNSLENLRSSNKCIDNKFYGESPKNTITKAQSLMEEESTMASKLLKLKKSELNIMSKLPDSEDKLDKKLKFELGDTNKASLQQEDEFQNEQYMSMNQN